MDIFVISIFCTILIGCLAAGLSVVYALIIGLVLFICFAKYRGFSNSAVIKMCASGLMDARHILFMMLIIGMLTAMWRASGCIPTIVCYASGLMHPSIFVLLSFLLCSMLSALTGTSVGTAATIGVICMSISNSLQIPMPLTGGAVLAGSFFGDRCSPVSTSAHLVCTVTDTEIFGNIRQMLRTAALPFAAACVFYLVSGLLIGRGALGQELQAVDVWGTFRPAFSVEPVCLTPAVLILILSVLRVDVKNTMLVSLVSAFIIALIVQKYEISKLLTAVVYGYCAETEELAALVNGGGIVSMLKVIMVVAIASCFSGIFRETKLLSFTTKYIGGMKETLGGYRTTCIIALLITAVACNQALAIMITAQLAGEMKPEKEKLAIDLEDSAVLIPGIIPWSVACATPLTTIGAPGVSILFAVYLYFIIAWRFVRGK